MQTREWTVSVDDSETRVRLAPAENAWCTLIFGHGAGSHMDHRVTTTLLATLHAAGCSTVCFNFLYRMAGRGAPDRMPRLQACFRAVIASVRNTTNPDRLLLGGHSMGGRVASMLAGDNEPCDALLLLGYPLHPPKKPESLRTAHLPSIRVPVLCCNGTRDALCTQALMQTAIADLPTWTMHWLEAADHGYQVLKRSGRTEADVQQEITTAVRAWGQTLD